MKGWVKSKTVVYAVMFSAGFVLCAPERLVGQQRASIQSSTVAAAKQATRDSVAADSVARAFLAADDAMYHNRVAMERKFYLRGASWAELGDRCNPGALRVFADATTLVQRDSIQKLVEHIEQTIIARGVGSRLDTPDARSLLRTIVGWEAGIDRPLWDADDTVDRIAVATGLTGEVPDPNGSGCLPSPMSSDTVTFVVPGFTTMEFPGAPKPRVKAYFGPDARRQARDEFYTQVGSKDPTADLSYWLIAPVVIWRDWALVGVDRPREKQGTEIGGPGNGGAVYMMHRVGTQWRLLAIVRTWGS